MPAIEISEKCQLWQIGDATKHPPADVAFLETITRAGYVAFSGPSGLCGGKSQSRSAIIIHRGRGIKWEVVFREQDADVVTTTTDLSCTTTAVLSW